MTTTSDPAAVAPTIMASRDLESLLVNLREFWPLLTDVDGSPTMAAERLFCDLPTFGGLEPRSTAGVWSWDSGRMLVGASIGDMRIISRAQRTAEQSSECMCGPASISAARSTTAPRSTTRWRNTAPMSPRRSPPHCSASANSARRSASTA